MRKICQNMIQGIKKTDSAKSRRIVAMFIGLFLLGSYLWSQQGLREYIYLDGKLLTVESSSLTPPSITITSPTSGSSYSTSASSITLGGTASDNVGVTSVAWANDRGGNGTCSGTTSWTCASISLQSGQNVITVAAHDAESGAGSDTLTVTVSSCTYSISPASASFSRDGGVDSIGITAPSGCSWTATSNSNWITIGSGSSGNGNGTVGYYVLANDCPGQNREGAITVAGHTFYVEQAECFQCVDCVNACVALGYPEAYCAFMCGCD
jgi:hypothetical protein